MLSYNKFKEALVAICPAIRNDNGLKLVLYCPLIKALSGQGKERCNCCLSSAPDYYGFQSLYRHWLLCHK